MMKYRRLGMLAVNTAISLNFFTKKYQAACTESTQNYKINNKPSCSTITEEFTSSWSNKQVHYHEIRCLTKSHIIVHHADLITCSLEESPNVLLKFKIDASQYGRIKLLLSMANLVYTVPSQYSQSSDDDSKNVLWFDLTKNNQHQLDEILDFFIYYSKQDPEFMIIADQIKDKYSEMNRIYSNEIKPGNLSPGAR